MREYLFVHDLGTSGNKAAIFNINGTLIGSEVFPYPTYYPKDGWVEQDPEDWWRAVCLSTKNLLEKTKIRPEEIACISFSAQMMGCLLVDKKGNPLRNMLIWADMRSSKQEAEMIRKIGLEEGYKKTGHRLSASYSAAKLLWIKENEPETYKRAYKMLHVKEYIIHRLTGKFVTDYSDACGTNLLDIEKKEWAEDILAALKIEQGLLPDLMSSSSVCGYLLERAAENMSLIGGIPVVVGGGDGASACVGAGVVREGKAFAALGSSSWISTARKTPFFDKEMRTFNWIHLDKDLYTPNGTMQAAGYSYSWYKELLCREEKALASEQGISVYECINKEISKSPPGANGLLYLPYILGERSPRWNHKARGAFIGVSATTTKSELSRSVLEGVGFNLKIILDILEQELTIEDLIVIGGGAKGRIWMQILADIFQKSLHLPRHLDEATSIGAAICGGIGVGVFDGFDAVSQFNQIVETVEPNPKNKELYEKMACAFESGYQGLLRTYDALSGLQENN